MKSPVLSICLFLGVLLSPAAGQSRSDPMSPAAREKHQQSFFDWVLKRSTSPEANYGQRIDDRRRSLVEGLKTPAFWGQVIPWCWVLVMFVKVKHQEKVREQRLVIAARLLAQLHNSHVEARRQARAVIARDNQLVDSLNIAQSASRPVATGINTSKPAAQPATGASPQSSVAAAGSTKVELSPVAGSSAVRSQKEKKTAPEARITNVDYVAHINMLQGQLSAAHEAGKNKQGEIDSLRTEIERLKKNDNGTNNKDNSRNGQTQ